MQTIDTGYKPEFGLGAYFAGQNAANTEDLNQEELIKNFLANQKAREMDPLDITRRQQENQIGLYEQATADAKRNDPEYIKNLISGTIGQFKSQATAARIGEATESNKTKSENSKFAEDADAAEAELKIRDMIRKGEGSIGFPTTQQPIPATPMVGNFTNFMKPPTSTNGGADWKVPPQQQQAADRMAMLTLLSEWEKNPNDAKLTAEISSMRKRMNGSSVKGGDPLPIGGVNDGQMASPMPDVPNQVAMNSGTPEFKSLMQSMVDTPEQRRKMLLGEGKSLGQIEAAKIRAQGLADQMRIKFSLTPVKDAKTFEETIQKFLDKQADGKTLTPAEEKAYDDAVQGYNAKLQSRFTEGTTLQKNNQTGKFGLENRTPPTGYVRKKPISNEVVIRDGVAYERVEGGLQRKR
jgi:hypothetical protein